MRAKLIASITVALTIAAAAYAIESQSSRNVAFDFQSKLPAHDRAVLERSIRNAVPARERMVVTVSDRVVTPQVAQTR